jgi:hypothetical protein
VSYRLVRCLIIVAMVAGGCGNTVPSTLPSPSAAVDAIDIVGKTGSLPVGTYTRSDFEPPVTFRIDDGWSVGSIGNGFFDVQQRSGTPDVVAVQFGRVGGAIGADGATVQPGSAEEAAAAIATNPALEVLGRDASKLGGLDGHVVEVENAGSTHAPILDVPAGRLGIDPGRRLWIALFDTSDGLVAVMVGGSSDGWDEALALAEPVLESVVIGG